ncbi:MAG: type II toxin-antitoxin system RelE/ParE family toxin [Patescibacteria group bacterium]|nr:type II toxin-antitoxin system RelE/ParE family toxin [Patescibacteria group bacterium]
MTWKIALFESNRGENPVEDFIKSCDPLTAAKIIHTVDLLEKFGFMLKMPHSKKLTKEIYELRIRGKEEVRIFYSFKKSRIYLLHAFKKKTQKTPEKEIKTAKKRLDLI